MQMTHLRYRDVIAMIPSVLYDDYVNYMVRLAALSRYHSTPESMPFDIATSGDLILAHNIMQPDYLVGPVGNDFRCMLSYVVLGATYTNVQWTIIKRKTYGRGPYPITSYFVIGSDDTIVAMEGEVPRDMSVDSLRKDKNVSIICKYRDMNPIYGKDDSIREIASELEGRVPNPRSFAISLLNSDTEFLTMMDKTHKISNTIKIQVIFEVLQFKFEEEYMNIFNSIPPSCTFYSRSAIPTMSITFPRDITFSFAS